MSMEPELQTQTKAAAVTDEFPPEAVLAINIGNTMTTAGIVLGDQVDKTFTIETRDLDSIGPQLLELWRQIEQTNEEAKVVIGSVVANRTEPLCRIVLEVLGAEAYVIRRDLPLPMRLDVENPDAVGVDRVCAAAAAYRKLRHACIVADVGTAMTVNVVSDDGLFLGGAILPGPHLAAQSLSEHTAALPKIDMMQPPAQPIGRNTEQAILVGVVFGAAGALRELVERFATHLGKWPQLVLTGGGAKIIAEHCDFVDNLVPHLTLIGIALAWHQAKESGLEGRES